ncbi:protein of unknown function [Pseudomonas sp. JV551A1]|nr:protein of unknown function [Pseudomonas sp. JV551A1]
MSARDRADGGTIEGFAEGGHTPNVWVVVFWWMGRDNLSNPWGCLAALSRHKAAPTGALPASKAAQSLWERPCVAKGPQRGPSG